LILLARRRGGACQQLALQHGGLPCGHLSAAGGQPQQLWCGVLAAAVASRRGAAGVRQLTGVSDSCFAASGDSASLWRRSTRRLVLLAVVRHAGNRCRWASVAHCAASQTGAASGGATAWSGCSSSWLSRWAQACGSCLSVRKLPTAPCMMLWWPPTWQLPAQQLVTATQMQCGGSWATGKRAAVAVAAVMRPGRLLALTPQQVRSGQSWWCLIVWQAARRPGCSVCADCARMLHCGSHRQGPRLMAAAAVPPLAARQKGCW
jgi:hypothetical protein